MLVLLAHGTRDPRGRASTGRLLRDLRAARPALPSRLAFLDVQPPRAPRVGAAGDVVVPLLLASGTHADVDAPALQAYGMRVGRALGPDPLLADLAARRALEAGDDGSAAVLLVAAGSRDPAAADHHRAATLLGDRLGRPVGVTTVTGGRLEQDVEDLRLRHHGPVLAVSWLLAPGRFATAVRHSGADLVTEPLGAAPEVVQTVLARHDAVVAHAA